MLRRIMPTILLLVAMLLDTAVLPEIAPARYLPLLSMLVVIAFGLLLGRTRGAMYGLIGGLLLDISVSTPFGMYSAIFIVSGYLSGLARRRFDRNILTPILAPLICCAAYELFMIGYLYMASDHIYFNILRDGIARLVISVVLTQLMYLWFNRLLKPSWSRFSAL